MPQIDELFSNSFDQLIEHLFQKPSANAAGGSVFSSDNIGNFIDLYREKKQLEARLHRMKELLREKNTEIILLKEQNLNHVAERKSLRQKQSTTARESYQRTQFLAKVSHDLRTPINSIAGIARLLQGSNLDPDQQELVALIEKSSRSLSALIDDLLDISKVAAGAFKLEHVPFTPGDVVKECVDLLTVQACEKKVDLVCRLDPNLPDVVGGDPLRLRQVLINLIGNAIKFTEDGRVTVSAACESKSENEWIIRIQVRDTGIGISVDQQQTLFKHYAQADASIYRRYGGTGLGLAISRELVQLMGGKIGVFNNEDRGSTFWFTVRFVRNQPGGSGAVGNLPANPVSMPSDRKKQRILLVEDDPVTRKVSSLLLKQSGFDSIDLADNGLDAIHKLQQENYDLVLMDLRMPEMDGIAATRLIRRPDSGVLNPQIPIIAMTAGTFGADGKQCQLAGMNGFISKPIQGDELCRIIERQNNSYSAGKASARNAGKHSNPNVIDKVKLNQLRIDLGDTFKPLIELFLKQLPEKLHAIHSAAGKSDLDALKAGVHSLKGNCASFYAENMVSLCQRIEDSLAKNDGAHPKWIRQLDSEAVKIPGILASNPDDI